MLAQNSAALSFCFKLLSQIVKYLNNIFPLTICKRLEMSLLILPTKDWKQKKIWSKQERF